MSTANDNTAKWAVRKFGGAGLPVGFEYLSMNPNIPAGSLPLLGGVYSRTVYKDLWAWVQEQAGYLIEESVWQEKSAANEGNVPFYSKGDGTTTFRVPSLKCWIKGANGIEEVGSYLSAGLPDIRGAFSVFGKEGGYRLEVACAEAFYDNADDPRGQKISSVYENAVQYTNSTPYPKFAASKYNPIYGNSDTVQPKSIVGMWLVKAYGTVTNVGSTDVANIAQGLTELETNKLSLSGGTMTGALKFVNDDFRIHQSISENGALEDNFDIGWSYNNRKGAGVGFRGLDFEHKFYQPGSFSIYARNATGSTELDGQPDGTLTWGKKKVALQGSLSMPSSQYVNISLNGFVANSDSKYFGSVYTAPADGLVYIYCTLSSSPSSAYKIALENQTKGYTVRYIHASTYIGRDISLVMPMTKGDVLGIDTAWIANILNLQFYYAQSEV